MRLLTISFLPFIFTTLLQGQNIKLSGIVVDIENNEELPYANLMLKGHAIGTSCDSHGKFELAIEESLRNDSVIISYVGYFPSTISVTTLKQNTSIKLKPKKVFLNEIVVRPHNNRVKTQIVNPFKRNNCDIRYAAVNEHSNFWIPSRPKEPTIEALYFPCKEEYKVTKRLKEVWLQVTNYKNPPTYFNLHIFAVDNKQQPSHDLLKEPLVIKVTEKKQLIKVNLEKYNITFPDKGLFVGFELLIIDENKIVIPDQKGTHVTLYSPYLNYVESKELEYFWLYSKGEWIKTFQAAPNYMKKDRKSYYSPAIALVLWN